LLTADRCAWALVWQDITGKTPLMKATRNGKLEAVKRLLAAGCSVSVRDRNSDTALHFAARHGNARLLSALITASAADINMQVRQHRRYSVLLVIRLSRTIRYDR